jgi:hypothetical protein
VEIFALRACRVSRIRAEMWRPSSPHMAMNQDERRRLATVWLGEVPPHAGARFCTNCRPAGRILRSHFPFEVRETDGRALAREDANGISPPPAPKSLTRHPPCGACRAYARLRQGVSRRIRRLPT